MIDAENCTITEREMTPKEPMLTTVTTMQQITPLFQLQTNRHFLVLFAHFPVLRHKPTPKANLLLYKPYAISCG